MPTEHPPKPIRRLRTVHHWVRQEVRLTKAAMGWPADEKFRVPREVVAHFAAGIGQRGRALQQAWQAQFEQYATAHPEQAAELNTLWAGQLPADWEQGIPTFDAGCERNGHARQFGQGAESTGDAHPVADRWLGRPRALEL